MDFFIIIDNCCIGFALKPGHGQFNVNVNILLYFIESLRVCQQLFSLFRQYFSGIFFAKSTKNRRRECDGGEVYDAAEGERTRGGI